MGGPGWGWMEGQGRLPRKTVIWHLKDKWEFGEVKALGSRGKRSSLSKGTKSMFPSRNEELELVYHEWHVGWERNCHEEGDLNSFQRPDLKKIKFPTCQNMTSWEFDFCIEKSRDRCRFINRGMIFSNLYFRNVIPLSTKWKCTGGDNARGRRRAVRKLIVGNWRKTRESPDRSGEKGDANNTKKVEQI